MKVRLRKVGTGSVFLLALVIYGAAGLVVGGVVAAATSLPLPESYELTLLDRLGGWALGVFPVAYGLAGGIFAALGAVLYNVAAAVTGGIRVEIPELELLEDAADRPRTQPDAADAGRASASEAGEAPSAGGGEASSRRSSGE